MRLPTTEAPSAQNFRVEKVLRGVLENAVFLEKNKRYDEAQRPIYLVEVDTVEAGGGLTEREANAIDAIHSLVVQSLTLFHEEMLHYEGVFRYQWEVKFSTTSHASSLMTPALKQQVLLEFYGNRCDSVLEDALLAWQIPENPFLMIESEKGIFLHDAIFKCILYAVGLLGGLCRKSFKFPRQPENFEELDPDDMCREVLKIGWGAWERTKVADWWREASQTMDVFGKKAGGIHHVDYLDIFLKH